MAAGGWGFTSNPFNNARADGEETPKSNASGWQGNHGAWGGNSSTFEQERYQEAPQPPKSGGLFGKIQSSKSSGTAATAPPLVASMNAAGERTLAQREADLVRREAAIAKREQELNRVAENIKPTNWPPCKPMLRHNIAEDIPPWHRPMLRVAYIVWLISFSGFMVNLAILLAAIFGKIVTIQWFFIACIVTLLGTPGSFFLWYRSLYFATLTDGGTWAYGKTMLFMVIHIAWAVIMLLAIPTIGRFAAGLLKMLDLFQAGGSKNTVFGIMYAINVSIWGLAALGTWFVLGLAIRAYRQADAPRKDYERRHGTSWPPPIPGSQA